MCFINIREFSELMPAKRHFSDLVVEAFLLLGILVKRTTCVLAINNGWRKAFEFKMPGKMQNSKGPFDIIITLMLPSFPI